MGSKSTAEDILARVAHTGFPLELEASAILQARGYHVANSLYYVDQDEGKGREIDLRALRNFGFEAGSGLASKQRWVRHCLLIECKQSKKGPWVVFTSPTNPYDRLATNLDAIGFSQPIMDIDRRERGAIGKIHPYASITRRGRTYVQLLTNASAKPSGEDAIYKALTTVAKATIGTRNSTFAAGAGSGCIYYPLILLDGELWEVFLDSGNLSAQTAQMIIVSFFYQSAKYEEERLLIPIVAREHFPEYLDALEAVLEHLGTTVQMKPEYLSTEVR